MNIDNSKITAVMLLIAVFGLYFLIIKYVKPFGLAVDKKLYKLTLGRTRLRIFGVAFISYYLCVLCIWFFLVWFLFNQGLFDAKTLTLIIICITIITLLVATVNLKKSHKKDLTIFKRRRGQKKALKK